MSAEDELAIQRLVAIYSDAVSCKDGAAAAAVFAEDGVLHAFAGAPVVGRVSILEALTARTATAPTDGEAFSMQLSRFVAADIAGDVATGRSYYFELSRGPDRAAPGRLSTGVNDDRYVRTPDGWRIAHRRIMRTYVGDMVLPGKVTALEIGAWAGGPGAGPS